MSNREKSEAYQFAVEFLNDLKCGAIQKDCMVNHFSEFTGGLEELYREKHCSYLNSCGCLLMDRRLVAMEEDYYG